jgi:hypothetical protein
MGAPDRPFFEVSGHFQGTRGTLFQGTLGTPIPGTLEMGVRDTRFQGTRETPFQGTLSRVPGIGVPGDPHSRVPFPGYPELGYPGIPPKNRVPRNCQFWGFWGVTPGRAKFDPPGQFLTLVAGGPKIDFRANFLTPGADGQKLASGPIFDPPESGPRGGVRCRDLAIPGDPRHATPGVNIRVVTERSVQPSRVQ